MVFQRSNLFKATKLVRIQVEMQTQAEEVNCERRICVIPTAVIFLFSAEFHQIRSKVPFSERKIIFFSLFFPS